MGDSRKETVHGIIPFSGTGYENWKFRVERYLKSIELLDAVTQDAPTVAAELEKFQKMDNKASNVLISFIHDDLLDLIREKNTATEIWTVLENVYAKKSISSQTLVRKQLARLKMVEGTPLKEHLKTFDELVRQLKSAGAKLEEGDLVSQLFVTLPESYDPLVTALENLSENKLTLDVVRERLLAEELKKTDRMVDTGKEKPAAFVGFKQKPKKFTGKCHRCHKKGHLAKDCRVKLQAEANVVAEDKAVAFMAGKNKSPDANHSKITFKLDSGASHHLVNGKKYFTSLEKLKQPVVIGVAKDNQSMTAWHQGTICGVNVQGIKMTINNVLFVPDLRANLLSVKRMAKAGVTVSFGPKVGEMKHENSVIAICPLNGDFYELDVFYSNGSANLCVTQDLNL